MKVVNADACAATSVADLFIFGLGYEPRCTFVAESAGALLANKAHAIGYSYSHCFQYSDSAALFRSLGVDVVDDVSDDAYPDCLRAVLAKHPQARSIAVDISALNRARMAACVDLLLRELRSRELSVYFLYSSGKFVAPPVEVVQNQSIGPIGAAFSGLLSTPELPPQIVVGLGYETGKALGAVEYLQCGDLWLFVPTSSEPRFEEEVQRVNRLLMEQVGDARTVRYRVEDPAGTYADVRSVLLGMSNRANPILLPLGPKLFALVCLLIALEDKSASVWRASQGQYEVAIPREASGHVSALHVFHEPARERSPLEVLLA